MIFPILSPFQLCVINREMTQTYYQQIWEHWNWIFPRQILKILHQIVDNWMIKHRNTAYLQLKKTYRKSKRAYPTHRFLKDDLVDTTFSNWWNTPRNWAYRLSNNVKEKNNVNKLLHAFEPVCFINIRTKFRIWGELLSL